MSRRLVVSWDSFNWILYCTGLLLEEKKDTDVMIVTKDDDIPIYGHSGLCNEAIYAQRKNDLFKIGKELNVSKMMNLQYSSDRLDITKLVAQMNMQILMGNIEEVYCDSSKDVLLSIFNSLRKNLSVKVFFYGESKKINKNVKNLFLKDGHIEKKRELICSLVGASEKFFKTSFTSKEKFYKGVALGDNNKC